MLTEKVGRAELYLADCMDIMRDMPDKAFELAIVDPPYGDGGGNWENKKRSRFGGRFDKYSIRGVNHAYGGRFERYAPPESITDGRNTVEEISDRRGLP